MKRLNKVLILSVSFITVISSCNKEDKGDVLFLSNGSVDGTIKGTKKDNTTLNETFSFNQYLEYLDKQYYSIDPSTHYYRFNLDFSDKNGSTFTLEFTAVTPNDTLPYNINFALTYYKTKGDTLLYFYMPENNNSSKISKLAFDEKTKRVKANFSFKGTNNSTTKTATVEGSFDVVLKQRVE